MTCAACGAELPVAFPGATVTCVCGRASAIPGSASSSSASSRIAPASGGPYRNARATAPSVEVTTSCPFCSNPIGALVRICPHCDVRLDSVRCSRCFSLQAPGTFACARCGESMELEPLLDATDAPCPRCRSPLEVANASADARTHECPRCGGIFVSRDALADIMCRAEIGGALPEVPSRVSPKVTDDVRYLPCPLCHASMNRANFGRVSGVIVDVCGKHGTWFDAGELTRAVAFAAGGGLEKSRARERDEKHAASAQIAASHAAVPFFGRAYSEDERIELWRDFLASVFRW